MLNVGLLGAPGELVRSTPSTSRATPAAGWPSVADVHGPAARTLADRHGAGVATTAAILADPAIDAVLIATSTDTHSDLIEAAARAGKAVLCEKPVDLGLVRAQACERATAGHPVMIGFNRRFDPNFGALKAALEAGEIGRTELLSITSFDPAPPPVSYIQVSGGLFRDMMIHDFDMANFIMGALPVSITAAGSCLVDPAVGAAGDVDTAVVTLSYVDGRIAVIRNSRRAAYGYDQRVEVLGAQGMLQAENMVENTVVRATAAGVTSAKPMHFFLERYMPAYAAEWDAFVRAVTDDTGASCHAGGRRCRAGYGRGSDPVVADRPPGPARQPCGGRMTKDLDIITIGRSSVDLYGTQIGGRLEDMRSFDKYIGGSPTNIACGTARLGMKSAVITGVGDEHMGRFILEQLRREGVSTDGVKVDPDRLTALVLLGIRDQEQFPLIFYRENCADMGLTEDDIDPAFIARARAMVATGTHLSHPRVEAAVLKALRLARENGMRTALDIDYRPNLWGVAGHGDGESRFVESARVTAKLQSTLHLFDLIVGTEEEFHIAGGSTDTLAALRNVRAVTDATLVCKRGATGAVALADAIPVSLDAGQSGPGFPIEVFNVLGAGDGFMSGLLKGWLDGQDWPTALKYANACGAFAVSRHGCTPAYPSWEEMEFFFDRGIVRPDLRHDAGLEQVHWATNRPGDWSTMRVFAFDHRAQFEEMEGATPASIGHFKTLCLDAATAVAAGRPGHGVLCRRAAGARGALPGCRQRSLDRPARPSGRDRARWRWNPTSAPIAGAWPNGRRTTWSNASASRTPTTTMRPGPPRSTRSPACSPRPAATGWSSCWRSYRPRSGQPTMRRPRP